MKYLVVPALSKIRWAISKHEIAPLEKIRIIESKYLAVNKGKKHRLFVFIRVYAEGTGDETNDLSSGVKTAVQNQRIKSLFQGLRKSNLPFLYINAMLPSDENEEKTFEFDLVIGTWVDGNEKDIEKNINELEQRANILTASLSVAMPNTELRRLTRNELSSFISSILLPSSSTLAQEGNVESLSMMDSFENIYPSKDNKFNSPDFYVPNASESSGTLVLGNVISSGREEHQLKLRLEDLRKHTTILGMTGSGKTTTAKTLMVQIASQGLPVLVLDWHNEYRESILACGGRTFSPGYDSFCLNPLITYSEDLSEHIAIITDIFSDIYRFSAPQAYMFRNCLQRCLEDSTNQKTLYDLVRIIESYPLRSAYDNETKLALLRRLVPLTQGQVGKALNGLSSLTIDDLLSGVVCIELGHLKDIQIRSIFCEIILKMIYEYRMKESPNIEHLTIVEEARNITPLRRDTDPPTIGEKMVSELRKFGESMIFIAQFPTQLASEVIKNSSIRIVHRIAWHEDLELIASSLGLNNVQREYISMLPPGEAVLSIARLPRPVLLRIKPIGYEERSNLSLSELS